MSETVSTRPIVIWLLACCTILLALVMLGGATRLTGSGLSIVEWRPVTGILPPIGEQAWEAELQKYRQSPEYQNVNRGMSVAQFKQIFWFEYFHRLLARSLGLVFALPLAWFWWRGQLPRRLRWPMLGTLLLGAAQGYMGWYMVKSGLVDVPRVSPYRLTAHLGLALAIYAAMFWMAMSLLRPRGAQPMQRPPLLAIGLPLLSVLLVCTIVYGALVAGLRAGYVYSTFPLMDGQWVPDGLLHLQPTWRNFFESPLTVQFLHRCFAISTLVLAAWLWVAARGKAGLATRRALDLMVLALMTQVGLGIATLLNFVPVWLGTLHQGMAVLVLTALLWLLYTSHDQTRSADAGA